MSDKTPDDWMAGKLIMSYCVGVRVYDTGSCSTKCGYDYPARCPHSVVCRRYRVYAARWLADSTFEWRQIVGDYCREDALQIAAQRADAKMIRAISYYSKGETDYLDSITHALSDGLLP